MKRILPCFLLFLAANVLAGEALKVGDAAPTFTLSFATKDTIVKDGFSLASSIGKNNIILAFYPADWSGGCTKEMCAMRDSFTELGKLGAEVYGISGDYVWSHREWAKHLNLQFALLSDHDHAVAKLYQSYNPETGYNKRTIFVIDRKGKIVHMDLEFKAGTPDSFNKLKAALSTF
jgi:peroxiredoxin Q/BCP